MINREHYPYENPDRREVGDDIENSFLSPDFMTQIRTWNFSELNNTKKDFINSIEKIPYGNKIREFTINFTDKHYIESNRFRNQYNSLWQDQGQQIDFFIGSVLTQPENSLYGDILQNRIDILSRLEELQGTKQKQSFQADGFQAKVLEQLPPGSEHSYENTTINGEKVCAEGSNMRYTKVDFTPNGRCSLIRSKVTDSLAKGISGLVKYLTALDKGEVEETQLLIGRTNLHMALICQRIGFSIADQFKEADGEIKKGLSGYIIVGKIEDIRTKVGELQKMGIIERLNQRQAKLHQKMTKERQTVLSPSFA